LQRILLLFFRGTSRSAKEVAMRRAAALVALSVVVYASWGYAQQARSNTTAVPRLIQVTGTFQPASGSPAAPVEIATLAIYAKEAGGTPLWQETQNVTIGPGGRYTVILGATRTDGLPSDLFASDDAHWLGIRFERPDEAEQPRVQLTSVPYALRASDADTLGGRPASAYVLVDPASVGASSASANESDHKRDSLATTQSASTGWIPVATDDVGGESNSIIFQRANFLGVGTTTPVDAMHVAFTDPTGVFTGLSVQNRSGAASAYSGMLFYDHNGALGQFQGFNNATHEYRVNNIAPGGSINLMIAGTSKLRVANNGDIDISNNLTKNGALFLHATGGFATFVGPNAGNSTTTGTGNTAVGYGALNKTTSGLSNTAVGLEALSFNTEGTLNTAVGQAALLTVTTASENTGIGADALRMTTSCCNTAVGTSSLDRNTTGTSNTAVGQFAGQLATTGSNNIYLGANVLGTAGESNTMYLGLVGTQTKTVIAGVRSITTGAADAVNVVIDSNGQLGTINSSRRLKEDIQDMGDASTALMKLRPVTFRYKQPYTDGSKPRDYGLIAEEVELVYPDLVAHLANGEVETVQYHKINAMLLNELQKQHRLLQQQRREIDVLEARLAALEGHKR